MAKSPTSLRKTLAANTMESHIAAITVEGFKSFATEQRIEISPLTILAGANSSGKSSAMQPLLLLKQTLDATFDPGPLLLDGPHVQFTSANQFFSKLDRAAVDEFIVSIELSSGEKLVDVFKRSEELYVELGQTSFPLLERNVTLKSGVDLAEITAGYEKSLRDLLERFAVARDRCFFTLKPHGSPLSALDCIEEYISSIQFVIHVPALRGNPSRSYRTAAVRDYYPGTFENYVASVIFQWQSVNDPRLAKLDIYLQSLGLTGQVRSRTIDATQVELLVSRLSTESDLVNIADVGFGVSQVLPAVVALLKARPGQLVYIEQPELHLHPRAQQGLAPILADAAKRGVQVVVETHSSILLLAVQTLIAKNELSPEIVKLHWFQRDARGATKVTTTQPDELGSYGDWPEDFGEVEANADNEYLDAVEARALPPKSRNAR